MLIIIQWKILKKFRYQNNHNTFIFNFTGLTCYSCNTGGSGPDCIDNPNKYSTVECPKDDEGNIKDYCYTTRLEDIDEETGDISIYIMPLLYDLAQYF